MNYDLKKMTKLAMLASIGLLLMFLIRFPIIPAAPFLEYEPGDIPILIGTFLYGPWAGLIVTGVVAIIQALTVSAGSGWIGALMHFLATGTMVVVAGLVYSKIHTLKGAIGGLILGTMAMTLVMIPLNFIFTTIFLGVPFEVVKNLILPAIVPFNLIKGGINAVITLLVYKKVGQILRVGSVSAKNM